MISLLRLAAAVALLLATVIASAETTDTWIESGGEGYAGPEPAAPADLCQPGWCPLWTVRAGEVILHRSQPEDPVGTLARASGGETPNFDWSVGPDVSIFRRMASGDSLELRYFGALNFQINAAFSPVPGFDNGSEYSSRLNSTEINWRRPYSDRISWLAGFRWLELHEDFLQTQHISSVPISVDQESNVDNHLYGGQAGADVNLLRCCGPWSLDAVFKAGLYANFADRDFHAVVDGLRVDDLFVDDSEAAFVGEIGLTAVYYINDCWALRGGYQLLWIDGVALADEQLGPELNLSGDVFYHGVLVSLECTW